MRIQVHDHLFERRSQKVQIEVLHVLGGLRAGAQCSAPLAATQAGARDRSTISTIVTARNAVALRSDHGSR